MEMEFGRTYSLPAGNFEYIYCADGWSQSEAAALLAYGTSTGDWSCTPVTDYFSFANRSITVGAITTNDTWGGCTACSSTILGCTNPTATNYDASATVDDGSCLFPSILTVTTTVCNSASSVMMTGPWWNWDPTAGPVAVDNGNGTWTFTFNPAPTADMEYLLVVDGLQEDLVAAGTVSGDWSCTPITDYWSYANRQWLVGSGDVSNTYGTCGVCAPIISGCTDPAATNYDPTATVDDGSCIIAALCSDPSPTGLFVSDIIHDRVVINWDNMNSSNVPSSHIVNAGNYYYTPAVLSINVGDTVYFLNDGGYHNVNFDISSITGQSYNNPVSFVTAPTSGANIAVYVFDVAGTYQYDCSVGAHAVNGMVGTIEVNPASSCFVDQYRIKYRIQGTSSWSQKTMGAPVGSCTFPSNKTDKRIGNLTPSSTYEYQMKAWYCGGGASGWSAINTFTTLDNCPNVGNLAVSTPTTTKATFTWDDSNGPYSFTRLKARVDSISNPTGSDFFSIGGAGVQYPTFTKNKNGLVPGETYRGQARTWCDPNGGAYRSPSWTSL